MWIGMISGVPGQVMGNTIALSHDHPNRMSNKHPSDVWTALPQGHRLVPKTALSSSTTWL